MQHLPSYSRCCITLPQLTEDYERVSIIKFLNNDSSLHILNDAFKMVFMIFDIRLMEDYNMGEIFVFDFENFTAADALKFTPPFIKKTYVIVIVSLKKDCNVSTDINQMLYNVMRGKHLREENSIYNQRRV
jgi:hypothetical protein